MEGYKNPDNKAAAENWRLLMTRNMETLHYCGCAEALEKFVKETGPYLNFPTSPNEVTNEFLSASLGATVTG